MKVDRSQVKRWIDGTIKPRPANAVKLASILKVTLDDIYRK